VSAVLINGSFTRRCSLKRSQRIVAQKQDVCEFSQAHFPWRVSASVLWVLLSQVGGATKDIVWKQARCETKRGLQIVKKGTMKLKDAALTLQSRQKRN